jgi:hypothetical protein
MGKRRQGPFFVWADLSVNNSATIRKPLAATFFQAMLLIAVCLPTGSIFGLNVKMPVFVFFCFSLALYLSTRSWHWLTSSEFLILSFCCAGLCFWSLIAIFHGESETLQIFLQFKDIASTVLIAWLCLFLVRRKLLQPKQVIMPVLCGIVGLAALKLLLIAGTLGWKLDPIALLSEVFGEDSLVGGSMAFGLTRIEFSSDIVGAFVLFVVLCPSISGIRLKRIPVVLITIVLLASALLAYARYIWFLDGIAIVAAMMIERRIKLLFIALFTFVPVAGIYYEALQPLVEGRFFSDQVSDSDLIRIQQYQALLDEIRTRPLIGKGLGTHVNGVIRNSENRYSYELQWMSLLMQFGMLGLAGILTLIAFSARDLLKSQHPAKPWLVLLFGLWLLSGFTNPHLTSSFAGATFGMFMALFYKMRNQFPAAMEAV